MVHYIIYKPRHEISNNVVCATSRASDQPAHTRSLIRAFVCCLNKLLTEPLGVSKLKRRLYKLTQESTLVKIPHCWKSHVKAHILLFRSKSFQIKMKFSPGRVFIYLQTLVKCCILWQSFADPGGGGAGVRTPLEYYQNIGFQSNTGPDPLKITKLTIQHSMLGHHRPASETPFKWRFAGGPLVFGSFFLSSN